MGDEVKWLKGRRAVRHDDNKVVDKYEVKEEEMQEKRRVAYM